MIFTPKKAKKSANKLMPLGVLFVLGLGALSFFVQGKISLPQATDFTASSTKTAGHAFDGQVFFNDKPDEFFLLQTLSKAVDRAQKSVDIAVFSYDDVLLHLALNKAIDRGVKVRVLVSDSNKANVERLTGPQKNKYEIQFADDKSANELMHHKFTIIDGETLFFGSGNYTMWQEKFDPSFTLQTAEPQVVRVFATEFDLIWNGKTATSKLRSGKFKPFARRIQFTDGTLDIWLGPGFLQNSLQTRVIELINSAESSVEVLMWQLNDKAITKALLAKAAAGVRVTVIVDDKYAGTSQSTTDLLVGQPGVELLSDSALTGTMPDAPTKNFNPYIHQHTLIIDQKRIITGTNNWTFRGFFRNDEAAIETDISSIVNAFNTSFVFHRDRLR